jgi:hypothetical protein
VRTARTGEGSLDRIRRLAGQLENQAIPELKTQVGRQQQAPNAPARGKSAESKAAAAPDASTKAWVDAALDRVGNVRELLALASKLESEKPPQGSEDKQKASRDEALDKIEEGIRQVGALVASAQRIWSSYVNVSVDPRSLLPSKEKLAASLLAIEADRTKELAAIRAANTQYLGDLRTHLTGCVSILSRANVWFADQTVEGSLTATSGGPRRNLLECLHTAAAGAVVNQTPFAVEALRESIAYRRYQVRRDAIYNGAYEAALQAAGQRLSDYYSSGIKPNQIAQLLYYLSGIVSLPAIAF